MDNDAFFLTMLSLLENTPFVTYPIIHLFVTFWEAWEISSGPDAGKVAWIIMAMHIFEASVRTRLHWVPILSDLWVVLWHVWELWNPGNALYSLNKVIIANQNLGHFIVWVFLGSHMLTGTGLGLLQNPCGGASDSVYKWWGYFTEDIGHANSGYPDCLLVITQYNVIILQGNEWQQRRHTMNKISCWQ